MKKLIYISLSLILILIFSSCNDFSNFLDKAPGVDVTEDTIFSSKVQVETFVAGTYYYGVMSDLPMWDARDKSDCSTDAATDEAEIAMPWYWTQAWNTASMSATNTLDRRFNTFWIAIRRTNIILDKIDKTPFNDDQYKKQVRGEAKFIRAYNYFQLIEKYGGVPILDHLFSLSETLNVPRSSIKDVVNFIVQDCDDAIVNLPTVYPTSLRGRVTNIAAMALKSRTLLYAASKTFNTATPYMDFGANNKLICYTNYDVNRWKLAADASKQVLDAAQNAGVSLITDQGVTKNYLYAWEINDNNEIILAEKSKEACWVWHFPWGPSIPQSCGGFGGGMDVTLNFVKLYEKNDGTPQTWDMNGGADLMKKYNELDPRFAQTITYQGQAWNKNNPILDLSVNGRDACITGAYAHKPIPYAVSSDMGVVPNGIIFRLAEFYLNYAEALNEYNTTPPAEAYDAVNTIRQRSGMPSLPSNLSQTEFRNRVRNERAIELAFEGHRLYDIRRWEIAVDGIMSGNMYGIKINKIAQRSEYQYIPFVFEQRTFKIPMYRNPFPQSEINKGYLIQNPGW